MLLNAFLSAATAALALQASGAAAQPSGSDPCACAGAVIKSTCYPTLAGAVDAAQDGDTIKIGGTKTISQEIVFAKDLSFAGSKCKGSKATLQANFNIPNNEYGMFRVAGPGPRTVSWDNLVFTRAPGSGQSAGIRCGTLFSRERTEKYTDEEAPLTNLKVSRCDFTGLRTYAMGGSSLYVHRVGNVVLESTNTYTNNINEDSGRRFGGGGTVWMSVIFQNSTAQIGGTFADNVHLFEHGVSAGFFADRIDGKLTIRGTFKRNRASDGAAIHLFRPTVTSNVVIDGLYEDNEATELGDGSRGGAIRFQNVEGPVLISGTYRNNSAPGGRGGVVASNRFYGTAKMTFKGTFENNYAKASGGVFDQISSSEYQYIFALGATLTIDGSCIMKDNRAGNPATSILNIGAINATLSQADWVPGQTYVFKGVEEYNPAKDTGPSVNSAT